MCLQVYRLLGDQDTDYTNIALLCENLMVHIFSNYNISTLYHWDISWSNQISEPECMHWVWSFSCSLCFSLFVLRRGLGGSPWSWIFYWLVSDKNCIQHWTLILLVSYQLFVAYVILMSVYSTVLSSPYMCWMSGPKYSITSLQHITILYSLRVGAYTTFYDLSTILFYTKIVFLVIDLGVPLSREVIYLS